MNSIESRSPFFPNSKTGKQEIERAKSAQFLRRNTSERSQELNNETSKDVRVSIPDSIKDFSRIKNAVDFVPEIDNSAKIARLRAEINAGTYEIDYDAVADKMLAQEY